MQTIGFSLSGIPIKSALKHNEISNKFKEVKTSVDKIKNKSIRLENLDVEKKVTD